ncbi:hypothetical protein [Sphingobacterium pedocola]|nr:hypothetical protein [Sphingobacterium pedocola]
MMKRKIVNIEGAVEGTRNINFGDLTLFVGPHASGKSILLQMIKLLVDKDHIRRTTEQYGSSRFTKNTIDYRST